MVMIKTVKPIRQYRLPIACMFLLISGVVQAQPVIFSPDQWPKRWERAMQNQSMSGHFSPAQKPSNSSEQSNRQGWGQKSSESRHRRSRTPDYNYEADPSRYRYTVPQYMNYGSYPATGYYGSPIATYPYAASPMFPGIYPGIYSGTYPGIYPGLYPGLGVPGIAAPGLGVPGLGAPGLIMPGVPYSTPLYLGPGIYSGLGYPW